MFVSLTYNHLYDLVRRERGQKELQSLSETFYDDAKVFFDSLAAAAAADPLGGKGESARIQLVNGRKLSRQLYELREQKILLLSQARCRANTVMLDTANMTKAEFGLFDSSVKLLRDKRTELHIDDEPVQIQQVYLEPASENHDEEEQLISLRVLAAVPQFMGPEMEQYGPFSENDLVELPRDVASLLIRRGSAEKAE